jgi:hypothetical protein
MFKLLLSSTKKPIPVQNNHPGSIIETRFSPNIANCHGLIFKFEKLKFCVPAPEIVRLQVKTSFVGLKISIRSSLD